MGQKFHRPVDKIRFANLSIDTQKERNRYLKIFNKFLEKGIFIMGEDVESFEKSMASYYSCKYCIGVGSGTDALILALLAYDIHCGDEVIVADVSFIATANAISLVGAHPVFCDVNDDFNIDASKIETLITQKTKAIIPIHYGGKIANMDSINEIAKKYNLIVIEDASQAFGSKYNNKMAGTIGNIGSTSLNPMKVLGAFGEAGIITTNDKSIYNKIKALRYNGLDDNKICMYKSLNGKIDTLQAVLLQYKLEKIDLVIKKRDKICNYYTKHLKDYVKVPTVDKNEINTHYSYTILVKKSLRDKLYNYLLKHNVEVKINHKPMHLESAYSNIKTANLINSKRIAKMKIALPCHEKLKMGEVKYVVRVIKRFFNEM